MTPPLDPVDSHVASADDSAAAMFERTLAYEWRAHRSFWIALGLGGLILALGHALAAAFLSGSLSVSNSDAVLRFGFLAARNTGTVLLLGVLLRGAAAAAGARAVRTRYRALERTLDLSPDKRRDEERRLSAALRGRLLGMLPAIGLGALGIFAESLANLVAGL